jgi:hypothetical protein
LTETRPGDNPLPPRIKRPKYEAPTRIGCSNF